MQHSLSNFLKDSFHYESLHVVKSDATSESEEVLGSCI